MNNYKEKFEQKIEEIKSKLTDEMVQGIQEYYNQHKNTETAIYLSELFNCTKSMGMKLLNIIPLNKKGKGATLKNKRYMKECLLKKYGVDNAAKLPQTQSKRKQTCREKYGVEHPLQSIEIKNKYKNTCLQKYGVDNTRKDKNIKDKIAKIKHEKYGDNLEVITQKTKQTKLKNYNDENYNNREKAKKTCLKIYGTEYPTQCIDIKNKTKQTCIAHFGVENPMQFIDIYKKHWKKIFFDEQYFDSSWEIAFYIYNRDLNTIIERENSKFIYFFNGVQHTYYCDFTINGINYEIKSKYLLDKMQIPNTLDNAKYNCLINNNVNIITWPEINKYLKYVENKYGKDYLKDICKQ